MGSIIKRCKNCGKEFTASNRNTMYCSKTCKDTHYWNSRPKHTRICPVCGTKFQYIEYRPGYKKEYCSASCQISNTVPIKKGTCIDCGKKFSYKGRCVRVRCDKCRKKWKTFTTMRWRSLKDPTIKIGAGSGKVQTGNIKAVSTPEHQAKLATRRAWYAAHKEYLHESHHRHYRYILTGNDSCALCGYNTHQEALIVHHKDQDRTHNDRSNLIVLCGNCHMHVHSLIRKALKEGSDKAPGTILKELLQKSKTRLGRSKRTE